MSYIYIEEFPSDCLCYYSTQWGGLIHFCSYLDKRRYDFSSKAVHEKLSHTVQCALAATAEALCRLHSKKLTGGSGSSRDSGGSDCSTTTLHPILSTNVL